MHRLALIRTIFRRRRVCICDEHYPCVRSRPTAHWRILRDVDLTYGDWW